MTLRWREMDLNYWYRGTKAVDFRSGGAIAAGLVAFAIMFGMCGARLTSPYPDPR